MSTSSELSSSPTILLVPPCILSDDHRPGPANTQLSTSHPSTPQPFTYPIVDINLVLTSILSLVHVFPHEGSRPPLDPVRLAKALSVAAGRMRSCCGRVGRRAEGSRHAYELTFTDAPVPLHLDFSPTPPPALPSRDVLHPNVLLEPFLPPFDPLGGPVGPDEPLLSCKITRVPGEADVLGIAFHHVLGDADLAAQFGDVLGQAYRALGGGAGESGTGGNLEERAEAWPLSLTTEEQERIRTAGLPFFTTAHIDFSSRQTTADSGKASLGPDGQPADDGPECIQSLAQPSSLCIELYTKLFAPDAQGHAPIQMTVRLDPDELAALKSTLGARSAQEAVGAWWIELVRACEPGPDSESVPGSLWTPGQITRVVRMISYRQLGEAQRSLPIVYTPPERADDRPAPLARCIGNVVQTKTTAIPSSSTPTGTDRHLPSLSACRDVMHALRTDLDSLRTSPPRIQRWLARAAREYRRAVEPGMGVYFGAARDEVVVNAVRAHDWRPDFGLGDDMRRRQKFHTSWTAPRFLRVYRPNPSSSDPTCNGAELGFEAWPEVAKRIERIVELHRKAGWRAEGQGWRA